jgi:UDP-GlcNAc:undecaprenyl-phosphate GlcNAc-1-phosphate transferase
MTTYLLIVASALFLAVAVTPLARRIAFRAGMIDQPAARKQHAIPTPLLGGAAIYLAFVISLFILGDRFYVNQVAGILLGATLVSFLGLWDDRHPLRPGVKLAIPPSPPTRR